MTPVESVPPASIVEVSDVAKEPIRKRYRVDQGELREAAFLTR
jgi:hypothetical protein